MTHKLYCLLSETVQEILYEFNVTVQTDPLELGEIVVPAGFDIRIPDDEPGGHFRRGVIQRGSDLHHFGGGILNRRPGAG